MVTFFFSVAGAGAAGAGTGATTVAWLTLVNVDGGNGHGTVSFAPALKAAAVGWFAGLATRMDFEAGKGFERGFGTPIAGVGVNG